MPWIPEDMYKINPCSAGRKWHSNRKRQKCLLFKIKQKQEREIKKNLKFHFKELIKSWLWCWLWNLALLLSLFCFLLINSSLIWWLYPISSLGKYHHFKGKLKPQIKRITLLIYDLLKLHPFSFLNNDTQSKRKN